MTAAWILRRTRREARRHGKSLGALVGAFAALAALGGAAVLGTRAAAQLTPLAEHDVHVIAYLRDDVSPAKVDAISDILRRLPGVKTVKLVDSDEALRRLRHEAATLGNGGALLEKVEDGFLPRSLEVALLPSDRLPERTADLAARLRKIGGIAEVDAMQSGLAQLMSWLNLARWLGRVVFFVALLGGVAALLWSVSKGREQRRELSETLWLLGETPAGMRVPAGIVGAMAALVGAGAGLALAMVVSRSVAGAVLRSFARVSPVAVPVLHVGELCIGLTLAIAAGWFAGRFTSPLPRTRDA